MSTEISMRQLLACLNISVFDPVMEPALKEVCRIEAEQKAEKRDPFCGMVSQIGMISASLICFWGLRPYALIAGLLLFVGCGAALCRAKSFMARFFWKTYFLTGLLLLLDASLSVFPIAVPTIFLFFLTRSLFFAQGRWQRYFLSILFFLACFWVFWDSSVVLTGIFSFLGTIGLLFPLKKIYLRETGIIFTVFPLILILAENISSLLGMGFFPEEIKSLCIVFSAELATLVVGLRKDMEIEEFFGFFFVLVASFLFGAFISVGIEGAFVLFLTAFFTDCPFLGKTAAVLFACFLVLFFLSLPVSLFWAGLISLFFGVGLLLTRRPLARIESEEIV